MGLHAAASFSSGVYSANASLRTAVESAVSSSSIVLLISASVRLSGDVLPEPYRLNEHALNLLSRSYSEFFAHCGDSFFASTERGATLHILLRMSEVSRTRRSEMRAAIGAGSAVFSTSAELQRAASAASRTRNLNVSFVQQGGPVLENLPQNSATVDGAIGVLNQFLRGVTANNAVPFSGRYMSYLATQTTLGSEIRAGEAGTVSSQAIERLATLKSRAIDYTQSLAERRQRLERYANPQHCQSSIDRTRAQLQRAQEFRDGIENAFSAAGRGERPNVAALESSFDFTEPEIDSSCVPSNARCNEAQYDRFGFLSRCVIYSPAGNGEFSVHPDRLFMGQTTTGFWPDEQLRVRVTTPAAWVGTQRNGWMGFHLFVNGSPGDVNSATDAFSVHPLNGTTPIDLRRFVSSGDGGVHTELKTVFCTSDGDNGNRSCNFRQLRVEICSESSGACSPLNPTTPPTSPN